jgi:hypothetical protein
MHAQKSRQMQAMLSNGVVSYGAELKRKFDEARARRLEQAGQKREFLLGLREKKREIEQRLDRVTREVRALRCVACARVRAWAAWRRRTLVLCWCGCCLS